MDGKKTVYSAIKPTGLLTIGNYIGAIRNMVKMQEEYNCFYSIADLHSITVDIAPKTLEANSYSLYAMLLAFGLSKSVFFVQSHVAEHSQLTWVLNCHTQIGEAKRMTQFKDKSVKQPKNVNVGLFDYPVLMAADILLYRAHLVPIGKDQKQHLELSRTIAERFNYKYGRTFVVPDGVIPKFGAKINSLSDPTAKMGKTDEDVSGTIFLTDSEDDIVRKFKRAVTDSGSEIVYDKTEKPGVSNLLTIYSAFTGKSISAAEKEFDGSRYSDFKMRTADAVIEGLRPVRTEYEKLLADKAYIKSIMRENADKARNTASRTMNDVYRRVGFVEL